MINTRTDATIKAVTDSWDFWLSQHPLTVPHCIESAVRDAMKAWLDEHKDEIIAAIATKAAAAIQQKQTPTTTEEEPTT